VLETVALRVVGIAAIYAVGVGTGLVIGRSAWKRGVVSEGFGSPERQADGSLLLRRTPSTPTTTSRHILPSGGALERSIQVVVQPHAPTPPQSVPQIAAGPVAVTRRSSIPCPPVRVDLSLVRMPDQTRRVVASSPDGLVTGGLDIPVETPANLTAEGSWVAGLLFGQAGSMRVSGCYVERAWKRLHVGADLQHIRPANGNPSWGMVLRAGVRF
jgi:hypothetical protein